MIALCMILVHRHNQYKAYEKLKENVEYQTTEQETQIDLEAMVVAEEDRIYCERTIDFEALMETNSDIYAWIDIPGTEIQYPVLQTSQMDYYLNHNLDHSEGLPGCIYSNEPDAKDFSSYATVLYGHNMKNGTMFGKLRSYYEEDFFLENDTIIVYTPDNRFTYQIVMAQLHSDAYVPQEFDYFLGDGKSRFIDYVQNVELPEKVEHRRDFSADENDHFLILSTCYKGDSSHRYLIIGKLVEKAYYVE